MWIVTFPLESEGVNEVHIMSALLLSQTQAAFEALSVLMAHEVVTHLSSLSFVIALDYFS